MVIASGPARACRGPERRKGPEAAEEAGFGGRSGADVRVRGDGPDHRFTETFGRSMMTEEKIVRWTPQMKTILNIVNTSNVHLTADEIYEEARKGLPNISLGTVYRNLKRLTAQGMLSIVPKGPVNTFSKYLDNSAYFECDRCHKLYCIPYADLGMDLSHLSRKSGFLIEKCSLSMNGICGKCLQEKAADGVRHKPNGPARIDASKASPQSSEAFHHLAGA